MKKIFSGVLVGIAMTVFLAACGADPTPTPTATPLPQATATPIPTPTPKPLGTIRMSVVPGSQQVAAHLIKDLKLDQKYNFNVEQVDLSEFGLMYSMIQGGQVDTIFGGWHAAAANYARGVKMINVHPTYPFAQFWVVRTDSPHQSYADLKGEDIGHCCGPRGSTTAFSRIVGKRYFGFDPLKDSNMTFGAIPVLLNAVAKGDLQATLASDPLLTKFILQGELRPLINLNDEWERQTGQREILGAINVMEEFAKENPELVKAFVAAWIDAAEYANTHPETWDRWSEGVGIESDEGKQMVQDHQGPEYYILHWDEDTIARMKVFAAEAIDVVGEDFMPYIPDEAFTLAFNPY